MAAKNNVTLEIAGARYKMTSDAEEGHLQRLAALVNDRLTALGPTAARTATPAQMLAVVALGLADDLLSAEDRRQRLEDTARSTIAKAIARIDQHFVNEEGAPIGDAGGDEESP